MFEALFQILEIQFFGLFNQGEDDVNLTTQRNLLADKLIQFGPVAVVIVESPDWPSSGR